MKNKKIKFVDKGNAKFFDYMNTEKIKIVHEIASKNKTAQKVIKELSKK